MIFVPSFHQNQMLKKSEKLRLVIRLQASVQLLLKPPLKRTGQMVVLWTLRNSLRRICFVEKQRDQELYCHRLQRALLRKGGTLHLEKQTFPLQKKPHKKVLAHRYPIQAKDSLLRQPGAAASALSVIIHCCLIVKCVNLLGERTVSKPLCSN